MRSILRNEPPYGCVRLAQLCVAPDVHDSTTVATLAAELVLHPTLAKLELFRMPVRSALKMDALVDAAIQLRLVKLSPFACTFPPETVSALTRLVHAGFLQELRITFNDATLFVDGVESRAFCTTVRSSSLKKLLLHRAGANTNVRKAVAFINRRTWVKGGDNAFFADYDAWFDVRTHEVPAESEDDEAMA